MGGLRRHEPEILLYEYCKLSIPAYLDRNDTSMMGLVLLAKLRLIRHPFDLLPQ